MPFTALYTDSQFELNAFGVSQPMKTVSETASLRHCWSSSQQLTLDYHAYLVCRKRRADSHLRRRKVRVHSYGWCLPAHPYKIWIEADQKHSLVHGTPYLTGTICVLESDIRTDCARPDRLELIYLTSSWRILNVWSRRMSRSRCGRRVKCGAHV